MKRFISVILLLLLCGCAGQTKVEPVTKGVNFECEAIYYNESYECLCDVQKNGDMTVKFTWPADIEGLEFSFTKNGVKAHFKELEYINDKVVFENSVASLIYEVMSMEDATVLEQDDVFYIEGANNDFEYKLQLGATGLPIKITTTPDIAKVEFKKVKIK